MFPHHSLPLYEVKASAEGIVEGYASVFGGVDSVGDTIERGAFADSIASGRMPAMFWAHAQDRVPGKWERLAEDSRGLYTAGRLNLATSTGREAFEHVRSGDVTGLSIGYLIPAGGAVRDGDVRRLRRVDLREVSLVALPADSAARIVAVKADMSERQLEKALRQMGLSQRQAKALLARGYRGLADAPDDDEHTADEVAAIAAAIRSIRI
jgi:HK97 family phage prohead protease